MNATIYDEIRRGDVRQLNLRAMRYFLKAADAEAAAKCEETVRRNAVRRWSKLPRR